MSEILKEPWVSNHNKTSIWTGMEAFLHMWQRTQTPASQFEVWTEKNSYSLCFTNLSLCLFLDRTTLLRSPMEDLNFYVCKKKERFPFQMHRKADHRQIMTKGTTQGKPWRLQNPMEREPRCAMLSLEDAKVMSLQLFSQEVFSGHIAKTKGRITAIQKGRIRSFSVFTDFTPLFTAEGWWEGLVYRREQAPGVEGCAEWQMRHTPAKCLVTQLCHSWTSTQRLVHLLAEILAYSCLLLVFSKEAESSWRCTTVD